MKTKSALIKTTPHKIEKIKTLLRKDSGMTIITLNQYIKWKLEQNGIASIPICFFSSYKEYGLLEKKMNSLYKKLCSNLDKEFNYADLLHNHLCWETQKSFYFLNCIDNLMVSKRIRKFYFESFADFRKKRYSKCLTRLFIDYFRKKGASIEIF